MHRQRSFLKMKKKNEEFIGTCSDLTNQGLGVVKHDNFTYFVRGCLPQEEVLVHVTALKKTYGYGFVKEIIKKSPQRVTPKCSVARQCGGCELQHLSYEGQLAIKHKIVKDCFERIGKIEHPVNECLGMQNPVRYRNKVQVPVSTLKGLQVGFYRANSNDIVEFNDCIVQTELQNKIVKQMKVWLKELGCGKAFRHILVKHSHVTGEVMLVWIVKEYPFRQSKALLEKCLKEFKEIKSVIANINQRNDNVILGEKEVLVYGKRFIQEKLEDCTFNISSKSFYQINPIQTKALYNKAIELAEITKDDVVADVYCGTGTIGIFAAKHAKKVIGIEVVAAAVQDAKENAKLNNVKNIEFVCSDAASYTKQMAQKKVKIDVAIVDPPRKGLDATAIESLVQMNPKRIVYVSCDPATQARDCKLFQELNYHVKVIQPIDLFAHTLHTESIVLLERK